MTSLIGPAENRNLTHPLLSIQDLSVDFHTERGVFNAVEQVSVTLKRGETVAMVGESGSGKSVTALSVLQLLPGSTARYKGGQIRFSENGESVVDLLRLSADDMRIVRGNKIAMIFQEPMTSLNPVYSCGDQVMEAIRLHQGIHAAAAKERTIALFGQVHLPDPASMFHRYPHQLSGGQKQRVMIALAMSCNPSILIADEPTTALDVSVQKTILLLIKELQLRHDMGVLFITHDFGVVAEVADRVVVMYKGRMVEQGPTRELLTKPQHPYTEGLLACRPLFHKPGERLPVLSNFLERNQQPGVAAKQVSGIGQVPRPSHKNEENLITKQSVLVSVEGLSVWFPAKKSLTGKVIHYAKAVDDVSFQVYRGETLGLVGESGSGKTTLGRTLLRLIEPTRGKIFYDGEDLLAFPSEKFRRKRREMQIIFQDPYSSLNPAMSVGNAIREPMTVHGLYGSETARKTKVLELLEKVSLHPDHYNRYPHEFSGGQRQRIVIARALALQPSFIVCDESVSSLDVSVQAQVLNLLNDLRKEFGFTVIFISHDLSVVRHMSDRIMVMHKGKIEETGTAEQIYHHPQTAYTRRLIDSVPKIF